ncbi:E3 ubiquitin-protein ligase RNF14-like [Danio rerio]|uniref:E3 ubiquitin-protein ligase RNF14 n=1 Tax=Danio rerio TaxID=7955 RepID=A0A8M1RS57_DANRE|nr:E3 ubiquitin-protein ligase RNF14-like [Danio rerio]|eukprot:XP_002667383.2 E3 ubiquitin-protein ligase RNF14-like [Danio rerio]
MSANQEAQSDELLALASIYDDEEFRRTESSQKGEIHLCLELPPDFRLLINGQTRVEVDVSFLPPLVLSFELPTDYPSSSAPVFTLSSIWLSRVQITTLCKRLDELWEENRGSVVLFTWIQFLKEETLQFLNIQSPLEIQTNGVQPQCESAESQAAAAAVEELDQRVVQVADPHSDLLTQLLDFNEAQKKKVFEATVFTCGICFSENLGSKCVLFKECQHVYCKTCVKEYFEVQIKDGKVQFLSCPEAECTSLATPAQVKLLVSQEDFARYDRLLLQWSLNLMTDVVYCPRVSCCMAVMLEPDRTVGICPSCRFVFCTTCNRTYHGLSICKEIELRRLKEAREKEQKLIEEKERIEYEKQLEEIEMEDTSSDDWLIKNCKRCPACGTNIQRIGGCNKMICSCCRQYFCWYCLAVLNGTDTYLHFKSPCFKQTSA